MADYGDAQRLFLQIITAKRILTASEVRNTHDFCCKQFGGEVSDLKEFVMSINQQISSMGLTIRRYVQEDHNSDVQCFVLVNTWNDEATRHASPFTSQEFSFLRKIIEHLATSGGVISVTDATNLATHLETKMKISDGEALIDRLVKNQWLLKKEDPEGEKYSREDPIDERLSLSGLTLAELQPYFEDTFEDELSKCPLCKLITFMGHECPSCNLKFHRVCAEKIWTRAKSSPFCPEENCKVKWDNVKVGSPTKRRRLKD